MKDKFVIKGGNQLKGEIEIRGAKNVAFPVLAASLLTDEDCFIDNLPLIEDVFKMLKVMEGMGVKVDWLGKRRIKVNASQVNPENIPFDIIKFFRGAILLVGPLLARFNRIKFPPPGGCVIGARPIDTHLDAFKQLGIQVSGLEIEKEENSKFFYFQKKENFIPSFYTASFIAKENKQKTREVILKEFSVTATENVLLFTALSERKTILKIADEDYQVQELVKVLRKMGVEIEIRGGNKIEIIGKKKLEGFEYKIISDPIETGTFIIMALATQGEVVIKESELNFLDLFLKRLRDFGAKFKILDEKTIKIFPSGILKMDKIQSLPYPGIHSDLQPELGVLATQSQGPTLIYDPLYEGRFKYLEELNKMGAKIIFCDPHRSIVYGPTKLMGIRFVSPDLRAGAALITAGLVAKGETIIENIYQIDRGYEKIEERLQQLGADIKRVKEK